jgi:uncharacterized protein
MMWLASKGAVDASRNPGDAVADDSHEPASAPSDARSTTPPHAALHPLWRVALVFIAATLIAIGIAQTTVALFGQDYSRTGHIARAVAALLLYVPLVVAARRFLDRGQLSGLGVAPFPAAWRPLLLGAAAWVVPAAIGCAVVMGLGWSRITLQGSAGALAAVVAVRMVLVLIYEALPEELLFRGYLYHHVATVVPRWLAVVVQAVLFTLWGVLAGAAGTVDRIVLFAGFALVLGIIRARTGTVWTTVGFHLAFQTVAQVTSPVETVLAVTDLLTLQAIAFVLLPFVLGPLIAMWAHPAPPDWRAREPERQPTPSA